ncbi:MAG: hypothetical protein QF371_03410, partial [Flavobacteriales bacterium]|nr:hypothetical protein [Flavobacteriales bacterium]
MQAQVYTGQNFPSSGEIYPLLADTSPYSFTSDPSMFEQPAPWYFPQFAYDQIDTIRFVEPSATAFATDFTFATVALEDTAHQDFFGTSFLFASNGNLMSEGGVVQPPAGDPIAMVYNSPIMWLDLPLQLSNSLRDTAWAELLRTGTEVGIPVDSIRLKRTVFRSDTVDAVGTLTLPGSIFEDAIR